MMKCNLNHEVVLSLINYNPESGEFKNHGHLYTADDYKQDAMERANGL